MKVYYINIKINTFVISFSCSLNIVITSKVFALYNMAVLSADAVIIYFPDKLKEASNISSVWSL